MSKGQRRKVIASKKPIPPTAQSTATQTPIDSQSGYSVKYVVDVPFKYKGKLLQRGSEFHPAGSKNDKLLLSGVGKYVRRVESAMPQRKRKR